jgi:acyl-CoA hydrolase
VTASIDRLDFLYPVYAGDLVTFKASANYVGKRSMEIGVRVETENLYTGETRHTASAYLTYVALDKSGRPVELPPLILETEDQKRRNQEARSRREVRLRERTDDQSK